ncbi:hypothetical protein F4Y59_11125 [Candidatus Poribacteria bacterium]|nr:hypothetical protein [Candidatus Poribacteria bacterium]
MSPSASVAVIGGPIPVSLGEFSATERVVLSPSVNTGGLLVLVLVTLIVTLIVSVCEVHTLI